MVIKIKNPVSNLFAQRKALVLLLALFAVACDTGDNAGAPNDASDTSGNPPQSDAPTDPVNSGAVSASSAELQQTAEESITAGVGVNLGSIERLSEDASSDLDQNTIGAELISDLNLELFSEFDSNNSQFISNTLGINDPNAVVVRDGDLVTIDPDESRICAGEIPLLQMAGYGLTNCEQIMSDLRVEIDAQTNESGTVNYTFQNDTVLSIGYSENAASYELQLDGLQRLAERAQQLNGIDSSNNGSMSGAVRLSTIVYSDVPGAESGEISLQVTESIRLVDSDSQLPGGPESIALEPSTVFQISVNEASGEVSTQLDWGALQFIGDISDAEDGSLLAQLDLAGLTANATLNANTSVLSLNNLGIANTPLTVNINQVNSMTFNLSTFDVTLDAEQNLITFDGALGASFALNNLMGILEGFGTDTSANVSINAAAGTSLQDQGQGITQVSGNGSLSLSANATSNGLSLQQDVNFNSGECFASDDDAAIPSLLGVVAVSCAP